MLTNKKREGINKCVCAVSLYVAETPKTSTKDHAWAAIIHNAFRHCCVRFCQTTFLETAVKEISPEHENEEIQTFPKEERRAVKL